MMDLDAVFLSRLQFVWVDRLAYPAAGVHHRPRLLYRLHGGLHLVTSREIYFRISTFWIKVFSVAFGMGVVSGIVMPFQFGTNWSRFSDADRQHRLAAARL